MADEQEGLPIGTAQNAADVARKAEREAADRSEASHQGQVTLRWKDATIERAYQMMTRNCISSEAPSLEAFRFALTYLEYGD